MQSSDQTLGYRFFHAFASIKYTETKDIEDSSIYYDVHGYNCSRDRHWDIDRREMVQGQMSVPKEAGNRKAVHIGTNKSIMKKNATGVLISMAIGNQPVISEFPQMNPQ